MPTGETSGADALAATGVLDPRSPTNRIDTHGATILLNGDRAWKLKRHIRLRFFDFSTPELRREVLDKELELNRRFAPELYRAVHAICRDADGSISLDGPGEPLDWVLEMTRFDDDALLVHRARPGGLSDEFLRTLTESVIDIHASSPESADPHGAQRLQEVVDGNLASMAAYPETIEPDAARRLTDLITTMIGAQAGLLDARASSGRVRRGHGDLHLGNIAVIGGRPVPFDCLEFDEEMATTDVLYDLAFLVMDLWSRGLRHEANIVVNHYLDLSGPDEAGFCLLPIMLAVRATVRAHVSAAAGADDDAAHYLALALGFTEPAAPRLIAIGGGSGTGKTTVARVIAPDVDPAPGARILRTDVLRKRLAGVRPTEKLPPSAYTPDARAGVYDELARLAATDLGSGMSVVADAVFGTTAQQEAIAAAAGDADFTGIWLELPEAERISRIEHRGPDASDADAAVARRQTQTLAAPGPPWRRVDASVPYRLDQWEQNCLADSKTGQSHE